MSDTSAVETVPVWMKAESSFLEEAGTHRTALRLIALSLAVFFAWAAFAPLEEVTRGPGKVAPLSRGQIIQSLEGGILRSIEVMEGEEVNAGQVLAVLEDTSFRSAFQDLQGQTLALRASLSRLQAELAQANTVTFDEDVLAQEVLVGIERDLFISRRRKFNEAVQSLTERLALSQSQLALVKPLVARGAASRVEAIRLEREVADLRGQLDEVENAYFQEINDEIARKSAELASLNQQLAQKEDALTRTVLRSPVRGIVKDLAVTTKGGVVKAGETIMEIVPLDDQLYVEAEIRPSDVAFLYPGLPASVHITAYDYTKYGALEGELVFISADTIIDETRRDAEPYYRVRVLTEKAALEGPDGPLPIKPGMIAEVNIQTGEKTVLEYLVKPLMQGQLALSER